MQKRPSDKGGVSFVAESPHPVPIVAVGASAGGIKALKQFFMTVPERLGTAFVVVLHLNPSSESHLSEILSKSVPIAGHAGSPHRRLSRSIMSTCCSRIRL